MLLATLIGTAIRWLIYVRVNEFRLYYAKGCCGIISKKEDKFEKIKYLSLALDSYNHYLRKNTKFQIRDIRRFKAKIIASTAKEEEEIIDSICKSLESDRLELARYIADSLKVPSQELLINEPLSQKLKVSGLILATAIPIVISIIQFVMTVG